MKKWSFVRKVFVTGYNNETKEYLIQDFDEQKLVNKWISESDIDFKVEDEYSKKHDYLKAIWAIELKILVRN